MGTECVSELVSDGVTSVYGTTREDTDESIIWRTNHPHRLLCPPSTHCSIFQSWVSDIWFTYIDTGAELHKHLFIYLFRTK